MLAELLRLIESSRGELSREEICAQLEISQDTLQNLLELLQRKRRITITEERMSLCKSGETCGTSGSRCPGPEDCPLVLLAPKQFSVRVTGD